MSSEEIRERFRKFFEARGHKWVASSSLIPTDPSVLLTTAGMQQFKKYYTGEADPKDDFGSLNTISIQKCFRTSDIDEVGDETHLTFFEMMGNFSFGGYFKKEAISWAYEFLAKELGIDKSRLTATYFGGDGEVAADKEGLSELENHFSPESIKSQGKEDNFWGPTGGEGPCGPTVEFYIDGVEVWNLVFNEYYCRTDGTLTPLKSKGVDTGMGMERLAMAKQGTKTIFETDLFQLILEAMPDDSERTKRIIADHIKGSVFLISEGVVPSNTGRGYILRRLLRRGIRYSRHLNLQLNFLIPLAGKVLGIYKDIYPELSLKENEIFTVIRGEEKKFTQSLVEGMKVLQKLLSKKKAIETSIFYKIMDLANKQEIFREIYQGRKTADVEFSKMGIQINQGDFEKATISGREAFDLYQNYGFPLEMIIELAQEGCLIIDVESFKEEIKKHQEISRAGAEKKFGGHGLLLDTGELKAKDEGELQKVTRLHTATHLLQAALRKVLGDGVHQKGSDITSERTRFDFSFDRKLTDEELKKIEVLVNEAVKNDLPVKFEELPFAQAVEKGALYSLEEKYPSRVKLYYAGQSLGEAFSKELCGGPHVTHTGEVGDFKILKEEGAASGVRRIRGRVI